MENRGALPGEEAQVFLSYSRQDLVVAGKLAARLKAAGHRVWWDQSIASGETYDQVTEAALRGAACVVVLWTPSSVASRWVRSEATVAQQQGTLLPVMLAACQRPVMFELSQSRDLIDWTGNARDPRLKALIADVAKMVTAGPDAGPAPVPALPARAPSEPGRRWVIGGGVAALAAGAGGLAWWRSGENATPPGQAVAAGPAPSIMVMPFDNLSGDASQAWFADGMAEEIRSSLIQLPGLTVIGRVSSERFRDAPDLGAAAAQLGAATILTGSVRRGGDKVRVSAQLTDAATGVERWSQSYDRAAGDVLAVQSEIAASVANALRFRLGSTGVLERAGGTQNAEANEFFLRARELAGSSYDETTQRQRLALYDRALALDPNFALAWVSRGIALDYLSRITITDLAQRRKLFEAATASVKRAVRLAPTSGRAHSGLANQLAAGLDIAGAVREAETTLRLSPRDAINVANAGIGLAFVYPERGLATMQSSLLLDPFFFNNMSNIGRTLYGLGRLDAAFAMFEKVMLLSNGLAGSAGLATVHLLRRDAAAARRAIGPEVDGVRKLFLLAAADVLEKRPSREGSALQSLEALDPEVSGFYLARLYAWGGDTAAALTMLERAFAAGCRDLIGMLTDPFLSRLRGEPRFRALLARIFPADAIVAEERRLRTRA